MTIFLTTHYMEEAARASHIAVIDGGQLKEYGTPFSLKEMYAKDKLKLLPKAGQQQALEQRLKEQHLSYKKVEEYLVAVVPQSMDALPVLNGVKELIGGFEMVQGTMDDVFLNVTGKKLEA